MMGTYIIFLLGDSGTDAPITLGEIAYEYYSTVPYKAEVITIIIRTWYSIDSIIKKALWLHWIFLCAPGFIRAPPMNNPIETPLTD